jgi:hypothetical protein
MLIIKVTGEYPWYQGGATPRPSQTWPTTVTIWPSGNFHGRWIPASSPAVESEPAPQPVQLDDDLEVPPATAVAISPEPDPDVTVDIAGMVRSRRRLVHSMDIPRAGVQKR